MLRLGGLGAGLEGLVLAGVPGVSIVTLLN